jgi:hypothetical protein
MMIHLDDIISPFSGAFNQYTCDHLRDEGLGVMFGTSKNFEDKGIPYPHNLLRNVALDQVITKYAIVLDGDFVPSAGFGAACVHAFDDLESRGFNTSHLVVVAPGKNGGCGQLSTDCCSV